MPSAKEPVKPKVLVSLLLALVGIRLLNRFFLARRFFGLLRGGFWEGSGSPRNPDGWPWWASRGLPEPPGPGPNKAKHLLLAGPNVKVSLKFRRVPLDLRFGTRIDPPRSRNQGFDLNFSAPEGRGKGLDLI